MSPTQKEDLEISFTSEETEEFAPFWARELKETWLKGVASSCAMFQRIEDFILEIEDLERLVYEGRMMTKAKELKSRLATLQLRFNEASHQAQNVVDQALLDVDYLLLALTTYRKKLKEKHLGDTDEREAARATILHPVQIGKRAKARKREEQRAALKREREIRTERSYSARKKSGADEES